MALPRILIVEDDELVADVERTLLEAAGFEVDDVRTAEEALTRLATTAYDAMVLDLILPGLHGDALLRELPPARLAEMPVLAVSGYSHPQQIEALRRHGAADFLPKDDPKGFFDQLPKRLGALIAQRQLRK
jgi:CheY-like chemotaxis protein